MDTIFLELFFLSFRMFVLRKQLQMVMISSIDDFALSILRHHLNRNQVFDRFEYDEYGFVQESRD